jgi:hypothetical protein
MSRKNTAGSSITDLVGVMPRVHLVGGEIPEWPFPELGVETFKQGEMVCLSGSAGNRVGLTKPGTDASGYGIVGFAADNASGFTSSMVGVFVATPSIVFVGNVGHSATSANAQTAATDIGQLYGLTSLSGRTYVDKAKGAGNFSTASCRVMGFYDQDVVPTFYGRVYFQVLEPMCQLQNSIWSNGVTSSPVAMVL